MIRRAVNDQIIALYGAGALPQSLDLFLSSMQALGRIEAPVEEILAGELLAMEAPSPLSAHALDRALAMIDVLGVEDAARRDRQAARNANTRLNELMALPDPVRDAAFNSLDTGKWAFAGPGIKSLKLLPECRPSAELLRIEPGAGVPVHDHASVEMTLILTGAFSDHRARYGVGDICLIGPGERHAPKAEQGEVCYALAVSDTAPQFSGLLGLVQKVWKN